VLLEKDTSDSSLSKEVFPLGMGLQSWTTLKGGPNMLPIFDSCLSYREYSDQLWSLRPVALVVGISFYAAGLENVNFFTTSKEATFQYSVMFQEG
jgi:hypothetical protein